MYYFKKLNQHEMNDEKVGIDTVSKYVKKGNLNNRNLARLPDSILRVEFYRISKPEHKIYHLEINNVLSAMTDTEFNYKDNSNNIVPTRLLKENKIVPENNHIAYKMVDSIYTQYATKTTSSVVIKTFVKIEQRKFKHNQEVKFSIN